MSFRRLAIYLLLVALPLSRSRLAADGLPAWTAIGPGGDVQALAVSPALPGWILAGLPQGYGIFKSTDRGTSWRAATDAFGRTVRSLAIDAKGKAFYAATYGGLLKSTDGGDLWSTLDTSQDFYTLVAAHPRQAGIVFAVRGGVLLRSTDGGVTRDAVAGPEGVAKIAFAQAGRRTVVYAGAGNGVWRSTDAGQTWTDVSPRLPSPPHVAALAVHPGDPRVLYIGLQQDKRALFKSLDGGATWRLSQRGLPVAGGTIPTVSELAVDWTNPSVVYAVVGGALFRSVNGGRDWSRPGPHLPGGSINALETTRYGVLAGTSAGVLLSADRGLTWQLRIAGLAATSINAIALDHQKPARLHVANAPAGIFKTADGGRSWLRLGDLSISPGADQPLAVDPADPNVAYALAGHGIVKSTNGGRRWTVPEPSVCRTVTRIALDPREPSHLFASAQLRAPCLDPYVCTFFRSLDAGGSWQCLGDALHFHGRSLLGIDSFTSAVYAQNSFGFMRSTDDGETWTQLAGFQGSAASFAASPLVEGTLWAGRAGAVVRSRDRGETWQPFSAGLPAGELVVGLAPDPASPATLYAATRQSGVFKSTDAGETWSPAGLWPLFVEYQGGLLIDPGDPSIVYAGTNGLGVLRLEQSGG